MKWFRRQTRVKHPYGFHADGKPITDAEAKEMNDKLKAQGIIEVDPFTPQEQMEIAERMRLALGGPETKEDEWR